MIKRFGLFNVALFMVTQLAHAEVARVEVDVPQKEVWVGQKLSFYVTLRGEGPFVGAASFTIPQLARTLVTRVGSPLVSSEKIEEKTWLVQRHEFALFSQAEGSLELRGLSVRFTNKDGYTGPEIEHAEAIPAVMIQVNRPVGSETLGFLVTAEKIDIEEKWDPLPGRAVPGDVFQRTITQQADDVSGMALAPPPVDVPKGVRVYADRPRIDDDRQRGAFRGRRIDHLTYVMEASGTLRLPAIRYVWWNPEVEEFGSVTLDAVSFQVTSIASPASEPSASQSRKWLWPTIGILILGVVVFLQRSRLARLVQGASHLMNLPELSAARELLRACRRNDAAAAETAWRKWTSLQPPRFKPSPDLGNAIVDLHRTRFGRADASNRWSGARLAASFRAERVAIRRPHNHRDSQLRPLNPGRSIS